MVNNLDDGNKDVQETTDNGRRSIQVQNMWRKI